MITLAVVTSHSDNGSTFLGANKELKLILHLCSISKAFKEATATLGISESRLQFMHHPRVEYRNQMYD